MGHIILLALTLGSFAALFATSEHIHRRYTKAMTQSLAHFERDWQHLEQKYETYP